MLHRAKAFEEMGKRMKGLKEKGETMISIEDVEKMMLALSQEQLKKRTDGKEVAEVVGRFVNIATHDAEGFVQEMTTQHPTLQQNSFRLFVACMKEWENKLETERYDLRNEQTVKMSKTMLDSVKYEGIPLI